MQKLNFGFAPEKFRTNKTHRTLIKDLIYCSTKEWELNWPSAYPTRLSIYSFIYTAQLLPKQMWHKYFFVSKSNNNKKKKKNKPVNRIAKD